eukprot:TRINITY_DN39772_c0_g1_i1.p1 TRINITY_DN39772_c0_g1~~TRINITY_DN39772_c0_g1_i1.p1  ORF type:complete len:532 (-),score=97.81 TRINITY_DN39772_c0_g1_i1:51-1646(-)
MASAMKAPAKAVSIPPSVLFASAGQYCHTAKSAAAAENQAQPAAQPEKAMPLMAFASNAGLEQPLLPMQQQDDAAKNSNPLYTPTPEVAAICAQRSLTQRSIASPSWSTGLPVRMLQRSLMRNPKVSAYKLSAARRQSPPQAARGVSQRHTQQEHAMARKLWRLLQRLSPDERRTALLSAFTQRQRLALEGWVHQAIMRRPSALNRQKRTLHAKEGAVARPVCRSGMPGVETRCAGGQTTYRASVGLGAFRIVMPYFADLQEARRQSQMIARGVASVAQQGASSKCAVDDAEERFRAFLMFLQVEEKKAKVSGCRTLQDALRKCRCFVLVPAKAWIGRDLRLPSFLLPRQKDVEAGIAAWRRSCDIRGWAAAAASRSKDPLRSLRAWSALRQVYIDAWTEADPPAAMARIRALDALSKRRLDTLLVRCYAAEESSLKSSASQRRAAHSTARLGRDVAGGASQVKEAAAAGVLKSLQRLLSKWDPSVVALEAGITMAVASKHPGRRPLCRPRPGDGVDDRVQPRFVKRRLAA